MSILQRIISTKARRLKPAMAFLMAFLTLVGVVPMNVMAQTATTPEPAEFIYFDGERLYLDDDRIVNVVNVAPASRNIMPFTSQPTVTRVFGVSGRFNREPDVYMNSRRVSAQRYAVEIDGVLYEAFCADPQLPGPESTGAVYELVGPAAERYHTVLRYGFPTNPYFSQPPHATDNEDRMWNAYVTRVAVAMANNTNHNFTGNNDAISQARALVDGDPFWVRNFEETHPAIMVNGERWAEDFDNIVDASASEAQSETFTVTYNRRNHSQQNRFRFEWSADTPAGAELVVNGSVLATAPTNSNQVFYGDVSFYIQMPNSAEFHNEEAKVYLVGIHNQYANRVWLMQNPNNRDDWQDIVFYIPYMRASAAFSFVPEESEGGLRIVKRNPQGRGLAGAVFEITGPDGFSETRETPASGVIVLLGLEPGDYTITEITPPPGHLLATPNYVTVTIVPDSTQVIERVFVNPPYQNGDTPDPREAPPAAVRIQKVDALTRENIPDALIRIEGRSNFNLTTADGQLWTINNRGIDMSIVLTEGHTLPVVPEQTLDDDGNPVGPPPVEFELIDGVLTIYNLPWGYFRVQEERAPDGYSLLPQHTAYSFWLLPPDLLISVNEGGGDGGENGSDNGYGDDGSLEALLNAIATDDFGGPAYDLPEDTPPSEYGGAGGVEFIIDEQENVNSILITFENYPFSEVVVEKLCRETNRPLADAIFRIEGFFVEGNAPQVINMTGRTGADGRYTFRGLPAGGYTVSEVSAPPGFLLDEPNFQHVNVSWGQTADHATRPAPVLTFLNTPMAYLEVIKVDGENPSVRLDGAQFRLTGPDQHGATVVLYGTTVGGVVRFEPLLPHTTYILEEIAPPAGFVLMEGSQTIITTTGRNEVTWRNWRNPSLTIIKVCQDTERRLPGAHFTVTFEDGSIPNNLPELITNSNGEIVIDGALLVWNEQRTLIITEIVPPHGFHLGEENWQRVTLRAGYDQTVVFRNQRRPTITITKLDSVLGTPIPNAVFHIEKLDEPERGLLTGTPFRTDANGQIVLPIRHAGRYLVREIQAAPNYWLDPQQSNREWIIDVLPNEDYSLTVTNTLLPTLVITKMNMVNMRPVPLTWFSVHYEVPLSNNVRYLGTFMTNERGQVILPFVDVGWYQVREVRPAPGMSLNVNNSYRVFLEPGRNSYQLLQQGLIPRHLLGDMIADDDYISEDILPELPPNHDVPSEDVNIPSDGYEQLPPQENPIPDDIWDLPMTGIAPTVADITGSMQWSDGSNFRDGASEVWNWPLNSIIIRKICNRTGQLLPNATFDLIHISQGQTGTQGQVVGTFTTNHTGIIVITGLLPGSYAVEEVQAPQNFTLSGQTRQLAWLAPDNHSIVELTFANEPFGSLLVSLRCEVTGEPIQNGEFRVTNSAGAVVGTANGLHRTNQQGEFLIPNVPPDTYIVTQTLAPNGYTFGSVQVHQTIFVPATGQTYRLEFTNQPYSALIIRKLDSFDSSPIPGAIFRVNRPNGELIGEFTTDQLGMVEITGLLGYFSITELFVPAGFERDTTTVRTTHVMPQAPSIVTFFSPRLGSLTIEAVDSFGTPIAGAGFRVSRQNGELVGTYTTPASGIINLPTLTSGWYVVEPTTPPTGFITADTGRSVDVQPNSAPRTTFVYHRLSVLTIEAVDGDTGAALAGVQFEVRRPNGERISVGTTNNAGVFVVNNIDPRQGAVVIEPLSAPTGFVINEQARTIEFALGQNRSERFRAYRMGNMVIELTSENGNPLQGGRFRVTRPNGTILGEFTTPVSGLITINNLESGAYIVEQIAPPTNWVMTDTGRTVEIQATQTTRVQFINTQRPSLVIEKVDEAGNPLQGAEFEVRTVTGALVMRVVTNNGGVATIANLEPGVYLIEEVRAPQGFVITEGARTVEFTAGQTHTERFVNQRATTLTIEKVDEDGNPLQGAEFTIRTLAGELLHRAVTNNGGLITIPNMQPQTVVIEETRAPIGFVLDSVARPVEIVAGQNITERFVNHRSPSLIIEKVDENGAPLAGAEFEIRTLSGVLVQRVTTNSGGIATVTNLEPGVYILEEVRSPQGFVITEGARTIEFVAGQSLTERFVNLRAATLTIEKVDDSGSPLQGAEFEIRTLSGELLHRAVTNNGGIITIPNMPPQTVVIEETRAPQGFVLDGVARTVEISAGQNATERFVNHRSPSLIIEKVDENGAPLAGAEFEIRTLAGALVQRVTTNSGGIATITNLEPGVYILEEVRAPQGFVITESARTIEVVAGQNLIERFVNVRAVTLTIEKVDSDGNPLGGAEFEIRTPAGELLHRAVTNNGGIITIPNMIPQTVVIEETRAPQGFVIGEVARTVTLSAGQDRTERFVNYRAPSLIIEKVDENGAPLGGAEFEIRRLNGELVHRVVSNNAGLITIEHLDPGAYQVIETRPPAGHTIIEPSRAIEIVAGETRVERFVNPRLATFIIHKVDGVTNEPLQGVIFEITTLVGEHVRNPQNGSFEFITDSSGMIRLPELPAGSYVATEIRALPGYRLAQPEVFQVGHDRDYIITIRNFRYPDYNIRKIDGHTNEPLAGVQFEIAHFFGGVEERLRNPRDGSFIWTTDGAGLIRIPHLAHGTYIAREIRPLPGFQLADPVIFVVNDFEPTTLTIHNYRYSVWNILKLDGDTNEPLQGVVFEVARFYGVGHTADRLRNPNTGTFEFVTGANGTVTIGSLEPGTWIITETIPLPGFIAAEPQIITVTGTTVDTTITFRNYRMGDINLRKIDGDTDEPLAGVVFEIHRQNGERVQNPSNNTFEFVTDNAGRINMGFLAPGAYIAVEIRALAGYQLADPTPFEVVQGRDLTVTVRNFRMGDVNILKLDGDTNRPLEGVRFEIHRQNGERVQNPTNNSFEFVTDNAGRINLGFLPVGSYIAVETRALPGYRLADPTPFEVIQGRDLTVTIRNYRQAELTIRKICSISRMPLGGVFFQISRPDGTLLVNPRTGGNDFVTDFRGIIYLPVIEDGVIYVRETRALPGFLIDEEVTRVIINAEARQREHLVTIENTPAAGLLIIARNGTTGELLQGIEFEVRHADGRLVTGQMLDGNQIDTHANSPQLSANGLFVTDARGRIHLNHLEPGVYHVRVVDGNDGLQTDDNVHVVTVRPGEQAVLEVRLNPLAGLRLFAVDAITGRGLFNVEFMLFDRNGHNVGVFRTDNNGVIDFSHIVNPGRYTIRLTQTIRGYSTDDVPRTVEFVAGRMTTITWELVPQAGQIQIQVVSGDANFNNALPAGTPLSGAIFEVFEARTGNLVDRFVSGNNGMAVSSPLPLGRYIVRQVQAPAFYMINPNEMHVEIEFESQIIRITYPNFSANMAVTIRVTGPQMVSQGQPVVYEIMQMMNESTTPLADFYWRATLPVEAVRADRLITGTYNQNLRYRVLGTTNTGREIVIADNLSTTRNNVIELAPVHLGLAANEYIVDFILHFGQVNAGFMAVENPRIFVNVLPTSAVILPPNMMFALLVDVGGRIVGTNEWVLGNNTTAATLWSNARIPQSGW